MLARVERKKEYGQLVMMMMMREFVRVIREREREREESTLKMYNKIPYTLGNMHTIFHF